LGAHRALPGSRALLPFWPSQRFWSASVPS
jgi:hypothetical protein